MKKILFAVLLLGWANYANATGWTCTRDATFIASAGYVVYGNCAGSGTYTVSGDAVNPVGGAGTLAQNTIDAAIGFCGGSTKVLKRVLLNGTWDGSATINAQLSYNFVTQRIVANATSGASQLLFVELAVTQNLSSVDAFFIALCQ